MWGIVSFGCNCELFDSGFTDFKSVGFVPVGLLLFWICLLFSRRTSVLVDLGRLLR